MGSAPRIGCLVAAVILNPFHTGSSYVLAQQSTSEGAIRQVAAENCRCGRWTCQACQRQRLCPPTMQIMPETYIVPDRMLVPETAPGTDMAPTELSPAPDVIPEMEDALAPEDFAAPTPPTTSPSVASPSVASPSAADLFASNQAAGTGAFGSSLLGATTPEMMGDFFGPLPSVFSIQDGRFRLPVPSPGYNLGRVKQSENSSPIPTDRFFFNYSLFDDVPLAFGGTTVNRFTPGFEKTFLDGLASIELRMPLGTSLDTSLNVTGLNSDSRFQVGNMLTTFKGLLIEGQNHVLTGGLSLLLPTANDVKVLDPSGTEILTITNESTHLMPFVGGAWTNGNRLFAQWMLQVDVDANGNSVFASPSRQQPAREVGTLQDFTLLYTDLSLGYWIHRVQCGPRAGCGIATLAELHHNRSLNDIDAVTDGGSFVIQTIPELDNLNATFGLMFQLHRRTRLAIGYATPLGNGADRIFDNELRVTLNRFF